MKWKVATISVVVLVVLTGLWFIGDAPLEVEAANFSVKVGSEDAWVNTGIDGDNLVAVEVVKTDNDYAVSVELDSEGQRILRDISSKNIGKQLGIFFKNEPITAPTITGEFDTDIISVDGITDEKLALAYRDEILNPEPSPDVYRSSAVNGTSMIQYGYSNDEKTKIYYNQTCRPGYDCSFQCTVKKCRDGEEYIKRVISIKDDCYWFEGNPKPMVEGEYTYESFDSRQYGCLKPGEFKMEGVATTT
jgi:hypothetical protein